MYNENGQVRMPASLSWLEASTLPCAALMSECPLWKQEPAAGAGSPDARNRGCFDLRRATTSSASKAKLLEDMGADHVISYKEENRGAKAKPLAPDGEEVDNVIEVGRLLTVAQSLEATRLDGLISTIGFISGGAEQYPSFIKILGRNAIVYGKWPN